MPSSHGILRCESLEDRLAPAGDLDPTFGTGGWVTLPTQIDIPDAVATQSDGKIIFAGLVQIPGQLYAVLGVSRLNPGGSLDPSFGTGGVDAVPPDSWLPDALDETPAAVAVRPDGRIVVAEVVQTRQPANGSTPPVIHNNFAAVQLLPDGSLDSSFGVGGAALVPSFEVSGATVDPGDLKAAALQPDGDLVLAGTVDANMFGVVRLLPNGSPDPTFGSAGQTVHVVNPSGQSIENLTGATVQPDGRIVLVGLFSGSGTNSAVIRLNQDGALDATFGTGGVAVAPVFDGVAVACQSDGGVVIAGRVPNGGGQVQSFGDDPIEFQSTDFAATRLLPSGAVDLSFGNRGTEEIPISLGGTSTSKATSVGLDPSGRIVLAGTVAPTRPGYVTGSDEFGVALLNPDGSLYAGFGTEGRTAVSVPEDTISGTIYGGPLLAIQPDGKILLVGGAAPGINNLLPLPTSPVVARLLSDLSVSPSSVLVGGRPDGTAVVLTPLGGVYQPANTVAFFPGFSGAVRTAVADVNGDGVLDVIGGAGPGGGPRVVVIDGKTGTRLADFFAFESTFTGGIFVAAGDINGDGKADLVVTADRGGGPVVAVYDGAKLAAGLNEKAQIARFYGIDDPNFRGGTRAAVGDVNGDGKADLLISAGFGGGPREALYDGAGLTAVGTPPKLVPDFFAFEDSVRNGAYVALGDLNGDGKADLIFGGGPGGAPRVRVFDGAKLLAAGSFQNLDQIPQAQLADFFASDASSRGGIRLAVGTVNGTKALLTGSGEKEAAQVSIFTAPTLFGSVNPSPDRVIDMFGGGPLSDGVFVG
jgi:uncharacterized delta-60 repeat protein